MAPKTPDGSRFDAQLAFRRRWVPSVQLGLIFIIVMMGVNALLNSNHMPEAFGEQAGTVRRGLAALLWLVGLALAIIGYVIGKRLGVLLPQPKSEFAKLTLQDRRSLWTRFLKREALSTHDIELLRSWKSSAQEQNRSARWSVAGMVLGLGGASLAFPGVVGVILPISFAFLAVFLPVVSYIEKGRLARTP